MVGGVIVVLPGHLLREQFLRQCGTYVDACAG